MIGYCKKNGSSAALTAMEQGDPERFAAKIRACRIDLDAWDSESRGAGEVRRKETWFHLFSRVTQSVSVGEEGGIIWLTREEYVYWMKQWMGQVD